MMSARKGKVRTTQEIVKELSLRSHSPGLRGSGVGGAGDAAASHGGGGNGSHLASETKTELMNRFFDSQHGQEQQSDYPVISPPLSEVPSPSSNVSAGEADPALNQRVNGSHLRQHHQSDNVNDVAVEDILSSLPVIDADDVRAEWEEVEDDDDDDDVDGLIPVKRPEVEVTEDLVSRLNHEPMENFNGNFNHEGDFKEWHEVVSKETKGGELLYVLPYSVIE